MTVIVLLLCSFMLKMKVIRVFRKVSYCWEARLPIEHLTLSVPNRVYIWFPLTVLVLYSPIVPRSRSSYGYRYTTPSYSSLWLFLNLRIEILPVIPFKRKRKSGRRHTNTMVPAFQLETSSTNRVTVLYEQQHVAAGVREHR
jgi:hypothetical protein